MRHFYTFFILISVIFCLSCNNNVEDDKDIVNSAYYWTTVFSLSQEKRDFISQNNIKRLYIRFFDVVVDEQERLMHNATIQFQDSVPEDIEVVPTIFITNECMNLNTDSLPDRVVRRTRQMCKTHHIDNVKELQIDCDWTKTTQQRMFELVKKTKEILNKQGWKLSVTVRLHQLQTQLPEADRGVLMVYNTGDVADPKCSNPILNFEDVTPYLKYLKDCKMKLSAAYPIYDWNVLFRQGHFIGIQHFDEEYPTMEGDTIIHHETTTKQINEIKEAINNIAPKTNQEIILYDLSDKNISRFTTQNFKSIYQRHNN